jgi:hypothetical protein
LGVVTHISEVRPWKPFSDVDLNCKSWKHTCRIIQTVIGTVVDVAVVSRPVKVFLALGVLPKPCPNFRLAISRVPDRTWIAVSIRDPCRVRGADSPGVYEDTAPVDML